ncbi:MAG TPA: VOC family protein [Nocardioidaceae bacterium]|nr:VOC family protein [Nocardioidaceae bacterium]
MPTTARIDAIGMVASDLAATIRFYRAVGCDLPDPDAGDELGDHVECDLGGVRLMFDTEAVVASFSDDSWTGVGRITLAAQCDSPADVDRLHDELSAIGRGSQVAPFDAVWGQRYASVLDPDDNRLHLYAPLAAIE